MKTKGSEGSEEDKCILREVKTGNTGKTSTGIYMSAPLRTDHGAVR